LTKGSVYCHKAGSIKTVRCKMCLIIDNFRGDGCGGVWKSGNTINHCTAQRATTTGSIMKKLFLAGSVVLLAAALSARAGDAKTLYTDNCAKCHGEDGKGQTKMGTKLGAKDYTDAKVQDELKDDAATKAIKEGLKNEEGKTLMKAAADLSDEDVKALVAYMRAFKK